jgi:hypothetical protein
MDWIVPEIPDPASSASATPTEPTAADVRDNRALGCFPPEHNTGNRDDDDQHGRKREYGNRRSLRPS